MKRILSLLLVLTMLCSLCTVFAQEEAPAEETPAEEIVETALSEPAAEETAAEPAEEAAEIPAEEAPAEEIPAEEPAAETPAAEPAAEETDAGPAADGADDSGTCGKDLTWELNVDTGVLTISGEGAMYDYTESTSPWFWNGDYITSVVIGDGVTSIGSYAFEQTQLKDVTIPAGVTSIGEGAFYICHKMTNVTILGDITSIPESTFAFCDDLKSVTIPAGVTSIGARAFFKCDSLTDVYYGGRKADGEAISVGDNNDLLNSAQWHYAQYDIIYDANGGSGAPDGQIGSRGSETCLSKETPTLSGYTFLGWSLDKDAAAAEWTAGSVFTWSGNDDAVTVYAVWAETVVTGDCGGIGYYDDEGWKPDNSVTWALNLATGVLTVSGSGGMANFDEYEQCWEYYDETVRSVVIEDGVTYIGDEAFAYCKNLTSVTIPDSVTAIGAGAFTSCESLRALTIPESVTAIGADAFNGCKKLQEMTIPSKVTVLELTVFQNCTGLKTVTLPDGITDIGYHAFYNCTSLESVTIPAGVKKLTRYAFENCSGLKTVTLPAETTEIGDNAFAGCSALADVYYCSDEAGRDAMTVQAGNDALEQASWHYNACTVTFDLNGAAGAIAPQTKEPGESVTLPDTVPARENYTFLGWAEDKEAVVPDYKPGTEYTAGTSVKLYAVWAPLSGTCGTGLTWTMDMQTGTLTIQYTGEGTGAAMDAYSPSETPWYGCAESIQSVEIGKGVQSIGKGAFYGCTALTAVTIPQNVQSIGEGAFYGCTGLVSAVIPVGVKTIDAGAFYGCTSLQDIYYCGTAAQWATLYGEIEGCTEHYEAHQWDEGTVTKEAAYMTPGEKTCTCTVCGETGTVETPALTSVGGTCGDSVNWVLDADGVLTVSGTGAMYDYENSYPDWYSFKDSITTVVIGDGVTRIGSFAFWECGSLKDVTIADSVQELGDGAFSECDALESISIPSGVTVLDYTFWCCTSLKSVVLPLSVTKITDRAFDGCSSLADVYYAGGAAERAAMTIDSYNDGLTGAFWHYTYYKVSYNANGGDDAPEAVIVTPGESVTIDEVGARDGYLFLGWAADPAAVKADYAAGETVTPTADMNLYAVWAAVHTLNSGRSYTAEIKDEDGVVWYGFTPASGNTYVLYTTGSEAVTITLYDAAGKVLTTRTNRLVWPMTAGRTYYYTLCYAEDTAAGTIGFTFGRVYTIKFDANGGTGAPKAQTRDYGTTLKLTDEPPVRDGWNFLGWSADKNAGTPTYTAGAYYTVNGNVTLYAVWEDASLPLTSSRSYTAQIAEAGGAAYYRFTPTAGKTYVLYTTGDEDVTITLYDAAGSVLAEGTNRLAYAMTANETYRYVIRYADETARGNIALKFGRVYTVKFNANGGTGAPKAQTKDYGTALQLPETIPVKDGYVFVGWAGSTSAEAAPYEAGGNYTANGNTTLYAVWAGLLPLASGRSYTAEIKAYSTGVYYSFTPANTNTYVLYSSGGENVTITLYDEAGNVIESSSGEGASVSAKLTAGETYVYRVSLNDGSAGSVSLKFGRVYTIRYKANGGTGAPAAQEKYYGRAMKVSETVPTREGYTFLGWSADKNAEEAAYRAGGDYTANGNTTLYAVWQENP